MMRNLVSVVLVFAVIMFASCGASRDEKIASIKELETRLLKDSVSAKDEVAAYNLQVVYTDFSDDFPTDPEAPEYLFKAANLSINLGWGQSAIDILNKFISTYPDHAKTPEAYFYKGYVYDNQLNDDVKAGEVYQAYIEKYPNHDFAAAAEASIKNLGKTDEELIKEFEMKNAVLDSLAADTLSGE